MEFGLHWVRRRQRPLTRAVLALFCAAWLQAAALPCAMAHPSQPAPPAATAAHHGHAAPADASHAHDASHGHHAAPAGSGPEHATHCPYCPPDRDGAASCDEHGGCAYPHEPQVDARAAGALLAPPPASLPFVAPARRSVACLAPDSTLDGGPPRVRLSISYCRFIE